MLIILFPTKTNFQEIILTCKTSLPLSLFSNSICCSLNPFTKFMITYCIYFVLRFFTRIWVPVRQRQFCRAFKKASLKKSVSRGGYISINFKILHQYTSIMYDYYPKINLYIEIKYLFCLLIKKLPHIYSLSPQNLA